MIPSSGQTTLRRRAADLSLAAGPALFLAVLVVWPLVAVLVRSLEGVGPGRVAEVLGRGSVRSVVAFTVGQAVLSTVLTLALGLPVARVVARYRFPGVRVLRALVVVPFVLPTVVVAAAFAALFERYAPGWRDTLVPVLAAHVFFNLAVVVRVVGGYWAGADRRLDEAAQVLGAGPWQVFRSVTVPRLGPVLAGAALLVFLFTFTSFGIIRILGGPGRATIETEIFRYAVNRTEFDVAAVLAALQLVVVLVLATVSAAFQRRISRAERGRRRPAARPVGEGGWPARLWLGGALAIVAVVIMVPVGVLIQGSLRVGDGYGVDNYRRLFTTGDLLPVSAARALSTSLQYALVAAVVASVVGVVAALAVTSGSVLARPLEVLTLVPLGVSAVTLGFGYLVAFTVFDLRRSVWLVPVSHAVIGLPFVLAAVVPALRSVDPRLREAAATLGAGGVAVRRLVDWPLVRGAVVTGAGFSAAVSLGEFGATSFLSRGGDSFTAPLAVARLVSQPGAALRGQALALSVVIGAVVAVVAALIEWRRSDRVTLL
ncbi:MAG: ABC transporter permease subunit [Acidimicrobiales bacterium]